MNVFQYLPVLGLCVLQTVASAEPTAPTAANPANPPAATVDVPAVKPVEATPASKAMSLESSYKREFALLQTQKEELQNRLNSFKAQAATTENALMQKIALLEQSNVTLSANEEALKDELVKAEHGNEAVKDNSDLLEMTYSQANTSLEAYQRSLAAKPEFLNAKAEQKLTQLFQQGTELIRELGEINKHQGTFFLQDGTETQGSVVMIGNIAAYGVSDKGSGILVPAGDNRLKLWSEPAAEVAQKIAEGKSVSQQKIFIFENRVKAVQEKKEKTFLEEVDEGGEISWIIFGLGIVAIVLILGRILLLFLASSGRNTIINTTFNLLDQNKKEDALAFCNNSKGPFARVLKAIIQNTSANPEHMDDVIAEAMLRENSALNRFGAAIVVIASVAPLIGLLGTVTGMIATFGLITEHGTGDPRLLSSGISIALVATEMGLVVAIPAGLAGSLLGSWSEGIKSNLEEIALRASNILLDRDHAPLYKFTERESEHKEVNLSVSVV